MKRGRVFVFAGVLLLFAAGAAVAQSDAYNQMIRHGAELDRAGNYTQALTCFQAAIRLAEHEPDAHVLVGAVNATGLVYDELGRFSDAIRQYRRGLTLLERLNEKDTVRYAVVLGNLGLDLVEQGAPGAGEKVLRESIAIYVAKVAPDDNHLAVTRTALAMAEMNANHLREAEDLLTLAIAALRKHPGSTSQLAIGLNNLGVIWRLQKRTTEAEGLFREAADITAAELGENHPRLLQYLNNLSIAYLEEGRPADADAVMRRALTIAETRLGPQHPNSGTVMLNYAYLLRKLGRKEEAKQLEARGKEALHEAARTTGAGMTVDVTAFRR